MRTAPLAGGIAGALLGIAIVTSGSATAAPGDPSTAPSAAPVTSAAAPPSAAPTTAPTTNPTTEPAGTGGEPSKVVETTAPVHESTAPASRAASSAAVGTGVPSGVTASRPRYSYAPATSRAAVSTYTGTTTTTTQNYNPGPAPEGFAATAGKPQVVASVTQGANGRPSPVLVTKTARTTKKIGHFSVTDLLLVLIFSAAGVAIVGAGGLWVTRR